MYTKYIISALLDENVAECYNHRIGTFCNLVTTDYLSKVGNNPDF